MPKFKVKISLASFEEIVDAPDENTAQNIAEEDYFRYIMDSDLNKVEIEEVE